MSLISCHGYLKILSGFFVHGNMYKGMGVRACTLSSAGSYWYYILSNNGIAMTELLIQSEVVTIPHEVITNMGEHENILCACIS